MDGEFVECPVETFITHYLPFEPAESDVTAFVTQVTYVQDPVAESSASSAADTGPRTTRQSVKGKAPHIISPQRGQILEYEGGQLKFIDYHAIPTTSGENKAYSYLEATIRTIGTASVEGRTQNGFRYHSCPQTTVKSEIPGSNNKIDGCIISDRYVTPNGEVDLKTTGIAVAFEYKLESGDFEKVVENNKQIVSASVQIMNDDVRRMFAYGVTIIGDMVTLWYYGRSHSAISEPFSFVKNPKLFIKVMMSFLFANEAELGYDPKVTRLSDDRLVFEMESEKNEPMFYRTVRTLSEYRSNNITGRMTRVWEVDQVSGLAEHSKVLLRGLVLKDVWLDKSSPTEQTIQKTIYAAIEGRKATMSSNECVRNLNDVTRQELEDVVLEERYKKFFLTILSESVGQVSKSTPSGARQKRGLLCAEMTKYTAMRSNGTNLQRVLSTTPQTTGLEEARARAARRELVPRKFLPKKQCRVVYAELCTTVGKLRTVGEVMDVLAQTLGALRLLYFAGWVHRDISSGNVMGYGSSLQGEPVEWQAKLCDLEYAKEYSVDGPASVDPKTGTPYFMANEVLSNRPLLPQKFPTVATPEDLNGLHQAVITQVLEYRKVNAANPQATAEKPTTVLHNFQHDVESIFWLSLYTFTVRVRHKPSQAFAGDIFLNTTELGFSRSNCLENPINTVLDGCLREDVKQAVPLLDYMREQLLGQYHKRNSALLSGASGADVGSFAYIHSAFQVAFKFLVDVFRTGNVELINETKYTGNVVKAPRAAKRSRSARDDDNADYHGSSEEGGDEGDSERAPKRKARAAKATRSGAKQ